MYNMPFSSLTIRDSSDTSDFLLSVSALLAGIPTTVLTFKGQFVLRVHLHINHGETESGWEACEREGNLHKTFSHSLTRILNALLLQLSYHRHPLFRCKHLSHPHVSFVSQRLNERERWDHSSFGIWLIRDKSICDWDIITAEINGCLSASPSEGREEQPGGGGWQRSQQRERVWEHSGGKKKGCIRESDSKTETKHCRTACGEGTGKAAVESSQGRNVPSVSSLPLQCLYQWWKKSTQILYLKGDFTTVIDTVDR